jgi:hypothetical protein
MFGNANKPPTSSGGLFGSSAPTAATDKPAATIQGDRDAPAPGGLFGGSKPA